MTVVWVRATTTTTTAERGSVFQVDDADPLAAQMIAARYWTRTAAPAVPPYVPPVVEPAGTIYVRAWIAALGASAGQVFRVYGDDPAVLAGIAAGWLEEVPDPTAALPTPSGGVLHRTELDPAVTVLAGTPDTAFGALLRALFAGTSVAAASVTGLAPVATSGSYLDLSDVPAAAELPGLAPVATSGAYGDLTGRPVLAAVATTGDYGDLSGRPAPYTDAAARAAAIAAITAGTGMTRTVSGDGQTVTLATTGGGGGGGSVVQYDVQLYTTPGAFTWTKPVGAVRTVAHVYGAGGGGQGGSWANSGTMWPGGAGGTGGSYTRLDVAATDLPATVSGGVGLGGNGSVGSTVAGTVPVAGVVGGSSWFGPTLAIATGGIGGSSTSVPGSGGLGGKAAAVNAAGTGYASLPGPGEATWTAGGGAGGTIFGNVQTVGLPGAAGGYGPGRTVAPAGGAAAATSGATGGAGTAGTPPPSPGLLVGSGGGGGGPSFYGGTGAGGVGGAGGVAAGGGGGGASWNAAGGAGGRGGDGVVLVVTECVVTAADPTQVPAAPVPVTSWDVQTYTTAGGFTWTRPAGAVYAEVTLVGAGGGGGGGTANSTTSNGGGGGTGGSANTFTLDGAQLPATVTGTVGTGGAGGVGPSGTGGTTNTAGNPGGTTTFGSFRALGGGGAGPGNAQGFVATGQIPGGVGAAPPAGNPGAGIGPGGGGRGYTLVSSAANAATVGGVPEGAGLTLAAAGANAATPPAGVVFGGGGGGGLNGATTAASAGGAGVYGGGGGGGGVPSTTGIAGGTGGKGGDGVVMVRTLCVTSVGTAPGGVPAIAASEKGAVNGVATLDGTGKLSSAQAPASAAAYVPVAAPTGFSVAGVNGYWKEASGVVTVAVQLTSTGATTQSVTAFTLPVGYRPAAQVQGAGIAMNLGSPFIALAQVTAAGVVTVAAANNVAGPFSGQVSFVAAG